MSNKPLEIRSSVPDPEKHPDLGGTRTCILRDTTKVRKEAIVRRINNRNTQDFHHNPTDGTDLLKRCDELKKSAAIYTVPRRNRVSIDPQSAEPLSKLI